MLLCPVRDCRLPLTREVVGKAARLICPQNHSFDIARSGYLNLLQPQERRSKHPGDTPEAVAARRRLHDLGVSAPLIAAVTDLLHPTSADIVLDAGCGDGYLLGTLHEQTDCDAHGIDISLPAINAAAKRFPSCEWIVGNADRFLPYADHSFSIILSVTARINAQEFRRVLRNDGRLLVAIPSPEDLIELRGPGRDRVDRTLETFAKTFTLSNRRRVTHTADLSASAVEDVRVSIYRPLHSEPLEAMRVTFSLDLLLFH